jgi:putative transposase
LKGELNAIIDKAREYGVPVLMVDPRNKSKICPIHNAPIEYGEDRIGIYVAKEVRGGIER